MEGLKTLKQTEGEDILKEVGLTAMPLSPSYGKWSPTLPAVMKMLNSNKC